MSKIDTDTKILLPDSYFEDGDEYPDEYQMLQDITLALDEYVRYERNETTLRVTELADITVDSFHFNTDVKTAQAVPYKVSATPFRLTSMSYNWKREVRTTLVCLHG